MKISKEGNQTLTLAAFFGLAIIAFSFFVLNILWLQIILSIGAIILFLFFLQFFRDPKRSCDISDHEVISPADGKVVVIEKVFEDEYLKKECIQLSIFMSPFDVHKNRAPINGKLVYYRYHKGKYLMAFNPKSSKENEQNSIVFENDAIGKILCRQIAGFVARRINFYKREGDTLKGGEEMGFIKFGSRMDVFLPLNAKTRVEIGQQVYAAKNILAEIGNG